MKNKKEYDFRKCHSIKGVIMSWIALIISIINIFANSVHLHGVWLGMTIYLVADLILSWIVLSRERKILKAERKELMKKCGFREDFDWATRFNLKTKVGKYEISTVDLGLDHSFGIGKPLYYETMIFTKKDKFENPFEFFQERYSTKEEAKKGHKEAIKYVKIKLKEKK